jgi:protein-S-isoprenylcysteine O-methyltransferase Ste14
MGSPQVFRRLARRSRLSFLQSRHLRGRCEHLDWGHAGVPFVSTFLRSSTKLFIGIVIFVGLPLVGWGVRDFQGFIGHPARLGYVVLVVLLQVIVVIKLPEVGSRRGKKEKITLRDRLTLVPLQVIPLAIVLVAPYSDRHSIAALGDIEIIRYLGLVLFCLGFIGMHWAEAQLDRQFSVYVTIQEDHKLITEGPYRYLRHPRYLGIILFTTGISLVFRSWLALLLVATLTLVLIWRIRGEEALMRQQFGTDWETYSQKSWRLIPFVY